MSHRHGKPPNLGVTVGPDKAYSELVGTAIRSSNHPDKAFLLGSLRSRNYKALLEWSDRPSPQMYGSPASYFVDCQISALLRKYPFSEAQIPGRDPEEKAKEKFFASEHRCKRYNQRLRALRKNRIDPDMQFVEDARNYIRRVLGETVCFPKISRLCNFTAGASLRIGGSKTSMAHKVMSLNWTSTPSVLPYALSSLWGNSQYRHCILPGAMKCHDGDEFRRIVRERTECVDYNKVAFVPKTAKTHRAIAIEPLLNSFVQKGTDMYIRKLLHARAGIDLSDQTKNQELALEGSKGGTNPYCTIDLSAASDSLSVEACRDLLPPEWFCYLNDIRSPGYMLDNTFHKYEKFCSMGNGFCFPLQSLIFASFCYAAGRYCGSGSYDDFSVYGDDIIVRQDIALLLVEMLGKYGFRTNVDKTFITGPFRESCGADWFEGQDVRPVHFSKQIDSVLDLHALHNTTYRSTRCELFFEEFRASIRSLAEVCCLRPGREPGDTAFSVSLDLAQSCNEVKWDRLRQCWSWREIISRPISDRMTKVDPVLRADVELLAITAGAKPGMIAPLRYSTKPVYRTKRTWYFDEFRPPGRLSRRPGVHDPVTPVRLSVRES